MAKRPEMARRTNANQVKAPSESRREDANSFVTWFAPASAFLFSTLVVWAILVPVDATSVFRGEALAQNLFWLVTAVLCAAAAAFSQNSKPVATPAPVVGSNGTDWPRSSTIKLVALIGVVLWLVIVTIMAGSENNPRQAWNGFWQVIALACCYYCTGSLLVDQRCRSAVIGLCVVGCIALSLQGLYQVVFEFPQSRAEYAADPNGVLARIPLDAPENSPQRQRFESRLNSPEPYATFALANSLATLLTAGLILIIGLASTARSNRFGSASRSTIAALAVAAIVVTACWFLTRSRTAYIALLVAGSYALLYRSRIKETSTVSTKSIGAVIVTATVLCGGGLWWMSQNDQLVLSEAPRSLAFRLEYWQATLHMIQDHGLFGIGLGNFQNYYPQYKLEIASETIADPHNWFLDIAATLSLPIAILLSAWLLRILVARSSSMKTPKHIETTTTNQINTCLLWGAGAGGFVCMIFLSMLAGLQLLLTLIVWCLAGAIVYALWPLMHSMADRESPWIPTAAVGMLVCLLASGSWQSSGIGVPLVILLAASRQKAPANDRLPSTRAALVLSFTLLVCFLFQAWRPVTKSWAKMQQAQTATSRQRRIDGANQAVQADRFDTGALAWLAQAKMAEAADASRNSFELQSRDAIETIDTWLETDRVNFTNWQQAGDLTLGLCETADQLGVEDDWLFQKAFDYYKTAVRQYPSSVRLRVQLATVGAFHNDWDTFRKQTDQAQRLSDLTPHQDKKLQSQMIWVPFSSVPLSIRPKTPGMVMAEPLVQWLRTRELENGVPR